MRTILIMATAFWMAGCASTGVREEYDATGKVTAREYSGGDPNYSQYVSALSQQAGGGDAVDASACNGDARCVENVAAFATIRALAGQNRPAIQPPAPKVSGWERFGVTALRTLAPLAGAAVSWHQSDNAVETSVAQYGFLGGVVRDVTTASSVVAQSGPTVTINDSYNDSSDNSQAGDTISDSGNVSDSYNTPTEVIVSGDGSIVGDGNDTNNGDNNDNSGDLRDNSDGPIDDHSCNPGTVGCDATVTPPEPIDP